MCGIVGIVSPRGDVSPEALERATGALSHRGPDARRQWVRPDRRVGLGHSRLSIIDLATGDQPIASEDERLHLVVNGEFYDFERIRADLEAKGHWFRTRSDSEIALHLFEEYGARCLHWLRGEFALVLWDDANRRVLAARDRFGIKPLYYAWHDGALYIASEAKALFAAGVPARWDYETLGQMQYWVCPPDRSPFAGVYQVPPGHYLLSDGTHATVLPYWDLDYPPAQETTASHDPQACIDSLREALVDACRLRLRADVPVACYLSGGLDSCAVLGFASSLSARPLRAYTLSFDHADYDERAIAAEQARLSGAEFRPIEIRSEHLAEHFADALYFAERPFVNPHCVAKYLLSRAVRDEGIKVVLTGEGSDEVFAGYPHFRRDLVLHNTAGQDPAEAQRLLDELSEANAVSQGMLLASASSAATRSLTRVLGFAPSFFEVWAQAGDAARGLMTPEFEAACRGQDPYRLLLDHLDVQRQVIGREAVNQSLYLWAKTALPNYILSNLGDRMEMAHSVEGRLPFLDHPLVERVARMPVSMKIRGMTEKYVLREASRSVLTPTVYRRQKHPFLSPPSTLQPEGTLYALMQQTLRGEALRNMGIFDCDKVTALLDALPQMDAALRTRIDPLLTNLLSLCLLQQRFRL